MRPVKMMRRDVAHTSRSCSAQCVWGLYRYRHGPSGSCIVTGTGPVGLYRYFQHFGRERGTGPVVAVSLQAGVFSKASTTSCFAFVVMEASPCLLSCALFLVTHAANLPHASCRQRVCFATCNIARHAVLHCSSTLPFWFVGGDVGGNAESAGQPTHGG